MGAAQGPRQDITVVALTQAASDLGAEPDIEGYADNLHHAFELLMEVMADVARVARAGLLGVITPADALDRIGILADLPELTGEESDRAPWWEHAERKERLKAEGRE